MYRGKVASLLRVATAKTLSHFLITNCPLSHKMWGCPAKKCSRLASMSACPSQSFQIIAAGA